MTQPTSQPGNQLLSLLEAMRLPQWMKNAFVLAPLLFARKFADPTAWAFALWAVGVFGLISSAVYLLNDICDRQADRLHPSKRSRPIASGRLSVNVAAVAAAALAALGMAAAVGLTLTRERFSGGPPAVALTVWAGIYLAINVLYSVWLKRKFVVDVIVVALGFVLRAMAGAAAIGVGVSPWLVVCTFSLCLFIALTKRRGELAALPAGAAGDVRAVNRIYRLEDLQHMLAVAASMAVLTYTLYCLSPATVHRIGSAHMIWTIPLVVYGMFRYNRVIQSAGVDDLTAVLLRDKAMWAVILLYVLLAGLVVQYGRLPLLSGLLEADGMWQGR